jgi:hypothetical protein
MEPSPPLCREDHATHNCEKKALRTHSPEPSMLQSYTERRDVLCGPPAPLVIVKAPVAIVNAAPPVPAVQRTAHRPFPAPLQPLAGSVKLTLILLPAELAQSVLLSLSSL